MAVTGTLYLFGEKGNVVKTLIKDGISFSSDMTKKQQVTQLLNQIDKDYQFEYLKDRGSSIQTRPTTREFYNLKRAQDGTFSLYKMKPNLLSRIIEVHKGHGPKKLKDLQKILGIGLCLIIITGLIMSLQIQLRVKPFIITSLLGSIVLTILFFL